MQCWSFVATLLINSVLLGGCSKNENPAAMAPPPVSVLAAKAVQRTVPNQLREIGTVEAFSTVNLKSRVEGQLIAIHFKEGELVSKGQLLFNLDPRPFAAALSQARANLAKDQAQATQAETDEKRFAYLLREGVGSQQQYDQAHANASALRATVTADRAAIDAARLNLHYTEIHSPIDGHTGNLQAHIGDLVKADADNPMVTIAQVQPIYVSFSIPEGQLPAVRTNMMARQLEVDATIPGDQQPTEHGVLGFVNNSVDRTTGTIQLKGLFQNENRRLWPGEFVNATLTLNQIPNAVLVPSQAIQAGQQGSFVFVVGQGMKVQPRPVVPGASFDGDVIIERGLSVGETVVTDGQLRLAPGATVTIKNAL
jgi:membrane fusion protein, multidrug efflux system